MSSGFKSGLVFNGYLDLTLENTLRAGEQFSLYWKSDGNNQKTFKTSIDLPYIFKSPIGLKAQLYIFKQDSIYQNTKTSIDLGYFMDYNTRIYLGYQSTESILVKHKLASKKAHFDYTRMRKIKWEYYTGKFTQEDYELHGWEPFDLKLKSDVGTYLEADNDLIKLLQRKMVHDETVSVVESIMGEIKQRSWQLRSFIDWERFISGN